MSSVVVRVEANESVGYGHLSRCLVLGTALREHGAKVSFVLRAPAADVALRVRSAGFELVTHEHHVASDEDRSALMAVCEREHARMLVIDGYAFAARWVGALRRPGLLVCKVDDDASCIDGCDVLLFGHLHAKELGGPHLVGPSFALVGRPFGVLRRSKSCAPSVRSVLVSLGASAQPDALAAVVGALDASGDVSVRVLAGLTPLRALGSMPKNWEALPLQADLSVSFAWADIAVLTSGVSALEACTVGLPMVALAVAANQEPVLHALARDRLALAAHRSQDVGPAVARLISDAEERYGMFERQRATIDGLGAERCAAALLARLS